jgi:hypothetical protein
VATTVTDYPSKATLRRALAAGETVRCYQPGGYFPSETDGTVYFEGPHYPRPHTWYAQATLRDGVIVGPVR